MVDNRDPFSTARNPSDDGQHNALMGSEGLDDCLNFYPKNGKNGFAKKGVA